MEPFGRQLTFYSNKFMQINAINSRAGIPTVQIEITKSNEEVNSSSAKDIWASKLIIQIDSVYELPDLGKYLLGWSKTNSITFMHSSNNGKGFKLNRNDNGTMFVGITDNKIQDKRNYILNKHEQFAFQCLVLSQLASIYRSTISDMLNLLKLNNK